MSCLCYHALGRVFLVFTITSPLKGLGITFCHSGARTHDLRITRPSLLPTELYGLLDLARGGINQFARGATPIFGFP